MRGLRHTALEGDPVNFSLPAFALKRPVMVTMLSLCVVALGVIAWFKMPLQFLPRVDRPVIGCYIPYPNATPAQVEQQITVPVEGEFRTIPGMRKMWSWSNADGCRVNMRFSLDVDMTLATAEVRDRIERLKLKLPDDVDRVYLQRFSSGSLPVMAFGLFQEGNQEEFTHQVRTVIEPRLRRLEGVADVQVRSPVQEKEVVVEFDRDTLRSMNLALAQVVGALQQSSLNMSVGTINDAGSKYYVRALDEYRRIENIANLVVTPNGTRLRDIARVRYTSREERAHVSLDGKGGAILLVVKESEANAVDTCAHVHAELERLLSEPDFRTVAMHIFFDQSDLIGSALHNLFLEGIYGGIMALCVLFLFLHRIGPTIIVSLAIPTSLVVALVFMFFAGMALNIVTMVSLIISIGMLVDNAIVVVENTIRHRQLGVDGFESAKRGAGEVGLAIVASTATTAVVFAPMFYLETGRMSVFMEQLGLPLIVALAGSLLIALTLIPLSMSRIPESRHDNVFDAAGAAIGAWTGGRVRWLGGLLGTLGRLHAVQRIVGAYAWCLGWTLRWRLAAFALLAGFLIATYLIPFQQVGMRDMPKLDTREVAISVELEQNFDMAMSNALFQELVEDIERAAG